MVKRAFALLSSLLVLAPSVALAQQSRAGVVTTLEGNVSARRVALPSPVPLKFKDDVFLQDTVTTGDKSLARMLLGGKAVVTVRERSMLTITEVPGRSTIELESGKFSLAVAREKMRPGEEIQIRTPNAIAGVRGTVVVTEVNRQSAQAGGGAPAVLTNFYVLRGSIVAQPLDPGTRQPTGTPLQVGTLQAYSGAGSAAPRVAPVPTEQVGQITSGLQPSGPKSGGDAGQEQVKAQAVQAAVSLIGALTGGSGTQVALAVAPATTTTTTSGSTTSTTAPIVAVADEIDQAQELASESSTLDALSELLSLLFGVNITLTDKAAKSFTTSFTSSSTSALLTLSGATVIQIGDDVSVVEVLSGGDVTLAGPLASITDSFISTGGKLLEIEGGTLTTTGTSALLATTRSTVFTEDVLIGLNGGSLTLAGPLLTDTDGTLLPHDEFVRIQNGATVTSTGTGALVQLDGTAVGGTAALRMSGSTMTLAGPLLSASGLHDGDDDVDTSQLPLFGIQGSTLTSTGTGALISITNAVTEVGNENNFLRLFGGSTMSLAGPLLEGSGSTFQSGTNAKAFSFIAVLDGSSLSSTTTAPLLAFTDSAVDSNGGLFTVRRSASTSVPSRVTLAGPLLHGTNSTFNTTTQGFAGQFGVTNSCCGSFGVQQGAELKSTTTSALVSLSGSTFIGSDADSGSSLFFVVDTFTGAPSSELVAPSSLSLAGPLLAATSSTVKPLFSLLQVSRSTAGSTTSSPFVDLSGSTVAVGGTDISGSSVVGRFLNVISSATAGTAASASSLTLAGPFMHATGSALTANQVLGVFNGGSFKSTTTGPLVTLDSTGLKLVTTVVGGTTFRGDFANVNGLGGPTGSGFAIMELAGPLLGVGNGSPLNMTGALVKVLSGGSIIANHPTSAFVAITGGTHSIASDTGQAMFALFGRGTATTSETISTPGLNTSTSTLTLGTDQPLQRSGSGEFLQVSNATINAHAGLTVDDALLSASAPLLNLKSGASLTTAADGLNLTGLAKLTATGPLVKLDGGTLTITTGHALRVMNGSFLNISGDLFSILNGGKLDIKNGSALFVSGSSVVKVGGGLVNFNNSAGALNIANSLCTSCVTIGGLPVQFQNGASSGNVSITNPIKNATSATTTVSGAAIVVDGANSKVIISGN